MLHKDLTKKGLECFCDDGVCSFYLLSVVTASLGASRLFLAKFVAE